MTNNAFNIINKAFKTQNLNKVKLNLIKMSTKTQQALKMTNNPNNNHIMIHTVLNKPIKPSNRYQLLPLHSHHNKRNPLHNPHKTQ